VDPEPSRRGAAALALGRHGDAKQRAAVRRILQTDLSLSVRLRAAQGLLEARDPTPIPVLLTILAEGNESLALRAEGMLRWAAGDTAPAVPVVGYGAKRGNNDRLWRAWWKGRAGKLTLPADRPGALPANSFPLTYRTATRFLHWLWSSSSTPEEFRQITDLPFTWIGGEKFEAFETRTELARDYPKGLGADREPHWKGCSLEIKQILRPAEHARTLGKEDRGERDFLRQLRDPGILVVTAHLYSAEEGELRIAFRLYVRVRAGEARVVAWGQAFPER
jgi:hypothetical protein